MRNRSRALALGISLAAGTLAVPAAAQTTDTLVVYRREVFTYPRAGRPDPFRSLLGSAELGVRFEDLTLRGVVFHPDPSRSVAVLEQRGNERRIRARVGDRIGGLRILAIHERSVDVLIEEFGVARRETIVLRRSAARQPGER